MPGTATTRAGLLLCLLAAVTACSVGDAKPGGVPTASKAVPMPAGPLPPRLPALAAGCPGPEVAPQFPPGGLLPAGATQIRICNLRGDRWTVRGRPVEQDFGVPRDALTMDVDRVVALVNAGTEAPAEHICGGAGVPTQVLWFSYPETDLAVTFHDGACEDLDRGGAAVTGGDAAAAELSRLLWEERATGTPPTLDVQADCSPGLDRDTPLILDERVDAVDAVICEYTADVHQARLGPDELAALNAEFRAEEHSSPEPACETRMLRGVTAWGDRFSWLGSCWDFEIPGAYPRDLHWQPGPQLRAALDSLPLDPPRR